MKKRKLTKAKIKRLERIYTKPSTWESPDPRIDQTLIRKTAVAKSNSETK